MTTLGNPLRAAQRGVILVVSLLMLALLTLLSVAMFRGFGLEQRIAGNTREKQHAFQAAQSALQYGEYWLSQGNGTSGAPCATAPTTLQVCSNPPSVALATLSPASSSWAFGASYAPASIGSTAPLPVSTAGGVGNYYAAPELYIYFLGLAPNGQSRVFQVTSAAAGGNPNAVSIVQSTYSISTAIKDLGGL